MFFSVVMFFFFFFGGGLGIMLGLVVDGTDDINADEKKILNSTTELHHLYNFTSGSYGFSCMLVCFYPGRVIFIRVETILNYFKESYV